MKKYCTLEIPERQECSRLMLLMMSTRWWCPCEDDKASKDRDEEACTFEIPKRQECSTPVSAKLNTPLSLFSGFLKLNLSFFKFFSILHLETKCEQNNCIDFSFKTNSTSSPLIQIKLLEGAVNAYTLCNTQYDQIHKYTNTRITQNTQIHKYSNTQMRNLIKLSSCADQAATGCCKCLHNRARPKVLKMVRLHSHHGREGGAWAVLPGKKIDKMFWKSEDEMFRTYNSNSGGAATNWR